MKQILQFAAFILLIGLVSSCKKEKLCEGCGDGNKPPTAIAGPDQLITLPPDSVLLVAAPLVIQMLYKQRLPILYQTFTSGQIIIK